MFPDSVTAEPHLAPLPGAPALHDVAECVGLRYTASRVQRLPTILDYSEGPKDVAIGAPQYPDRTCMERVCRSLTLASARFSSALVCFLKKL